MNQYGQTVKATWERMQPSEVAEMLDPEMFFTRIGEEIASEIAQLWPQIAGDDPPGETHPEKARRLRTAQQAAEAQVMRAKLEELLGDREEEGGEETTEVFEEEPLEDSRDWLAREMGMPRRK
ncbi:hypothetical protein [Nocardiopsis sp. NRRL B-16309]|uniref:hypothetical protein n=1 Tax=Nocardiopsis sp. NRRL B-16309 TaxID=1519494 RepID=UPI0006AECDA3|nr:hypothetical protein [Nocardiopsis sp. NRRL B-16309]